MMGLCTVLREHGLRYCRRLASLVRREDGISAVEFSLISPVLVLGTFATVDAGMAVYEEMMISNALRSGAHLALSASDEAQVLAVLQAVAGENFTVASGAPTPGELSAAVNSYCVCPSDGSAQVACGSTCTGGTAAQQFYALSASKEFVGILLPAFTLSGAIDVMAQ